MIDQFNSAAEHRPEESMGKVFTEHGVFTKRFNIFPATALGRSTDFGLFYYADLIADIAGSDITILGGRYIKQPATNKQTTTAAATAATTITAIIIKSTATVTTPIPITGGILS